MQWKVIVVGAGNLGRALTSHDEFVRRGFNIVGIFDADESKCGSRIGTVKVQAMSGLKEFVKKNEIDMGIIAVPDSAAQEVADLLIDAGIKGLLNMTMAHINAPDNISVADSRIVASLQQLSHCMLFSCRRKYT
jgi:redox-sensing transcriptional repressor